MRLLTLLSAMLVAVFATSFAFGQGPKKIRSIEGITEYKLDNGLQVLLFPDKSKPTVTVNITYFVGSRHEGYGEAGMAHLLEHLLFKGTPLHKNVPKELNDRGARPFNGTTWLDRTNYYETLPASKENLEFAIRFEADRMINSFVAQKDLDSEMTVVRNEFERGENSPFRILMQRMQSAAFDWHNYAKSTIGNRSDIERVPIDKLKAFYRKHYQPDNAMLVVAGKFDEKTALEFVTKYFGAIETPNRTKDKTYTVEPAQDGERSVTLRRVGDVALVGAMYHVPAGGHPDLAACQVFANIMGTEPSGRLYKFMVEKKIASSVQTIAFANHDPGVFLAMAEVDKSSKLEIAEKALLKTIEDVSQTGVTDAEVKRAKTEILAQRELMVNNTTGVAVSLSDWAAQGDWRLFFLSRDRIEKVTPDDVVRVAKAYFNRANQTVGRFIPSEKPERTEIPNAPDLKELLKDYKGRELIAKGEFFDPTPENVESRTVRKTISEGIKATFLQKKNRGESVSLALTLRYGNGTSLNGKAIAAEFLPELMTRGTKKLSFEQLQDEMSNNRMSLSSSGQRGLANFTVSTKRKNLKKAIELLTQILREPSFAREQFEIIKRESLAPLEQAKSDPQAKAVRELSRILSPFPKDDVRYTPTIDEEIEMTKDVSLSEIKNLYENFLSSQHGELAIVGDFELGEIEGDLKSMLGGWTTKESFARVPEDANTSVKGGVKNILTPDKANAIYIAGMTLLMKDSDEDYPAFTVANEILGGGALSSRLADRVRQKEGLSYSIGAGGSAHPIDNRAIVRIYAIVNPTNRDKLVSVINEELENFVSKGVTEDELERVKKRIVETRKVARTQDMGLARELAGTSFAKRTMDYHKDFENKIKDLKVGDVNAAIKKHFDLKRLTIVTAGDFKKAKSDEKKEEKTEEKK